MAALQCYSRLRSVPFTAVTINDTFWSPRIETNRDVTLAVQLEQIEQTGRLSNFRKAAGIVGGEFEGIFFNDSDVYKWIEAASYSLATHPDPQLEAKVDEAVVAIAKAQQPDGYLNTYFQLVEPGNKWTNLRMRHELYCAGHLFEAAVAHFQATGKRPLLDVACKFADHIDAIFGPDNRLGAPGHQEIELALIKLHHATREQRYLRLAQFFIDVRGQEPNTFIEEAESEDDTKFTPEYCQAHLPVRDQSEVVGHAVRAMYMYCAMTDLYCETGDESLLAALERLWRNLVYRRSYITGGIGTTAMNEGFTADYDLPNATAYAETCANIGGLFWNHRMLMATRSARFADAMERALYNSVLSGVGLDGKSFFYANRLSSLGNIEREAWFGCACCPPNIARMLASLGGYIYAQTNSDIYVNLYVAGSAKIDLNGDQVTVDQTTDYPWSGDVTLTIRTSTPCTFGLNLRVPAWCEKATYAINGGESTQATPGDFSYIRREWRDGDTVRLALPMAVQLVEASPHVEADFGRVALQRGPIVYCLEQADNGPELFQISLPGVDAIKAEYDPSLLGGVVVLEGLAERPELSGWEDCLYRRASQSCWASTKIKAVPYCCWANRQPGEMIVWLNDAR